jgi:hypothetical protein
LEYFGGAWTGLFPAENQKNFEELFAMYKEGKINPAPSDKFHSRNILQRQ